MLLFSFCLSFLFFLLIVRLFYFFFIQLIVTVMLNVMSRRVTGTGLGMRVPEIV